MVIVSAMGDLERRLRERTSPLQAALRSHAIYGELASVERVRCFLEHHVFAVWDFMGLLKTLQQQLTCVSVPWLPVGDPVLRRLVNELVLAEESDLLPNGQVRSHFELYLEAMEGIGADTARITTFLEELRRGTGPRDALRRCSVPKAAIDFVDDTLAVIESRQPHVVAAAFAIGREQMIPEVFLELVRGLAGTEGRGIATLELYLERHIAMDAAEHGPAAVRMLETLCGDDEVRRSQAVEAALNALRSRLRLWDAVLARLTSI